jgi:hypothetical protein
MHIEFKLPLVANNPNKAPAGFASRVIKTELQQWHERFPHIDYTLAESDDKLILQLGKPSDYSLFALTWRPSYHSSGWKRIRIVQDPVAQE